MTTPQLDPVRFHHLAAEYCGLAKARSTQKEKAGTELDGRKLAYRAKQMRPELNVLLLSGYGFPIIGKPFLESDLKRVMSKTTELC